MASRKKHSVIRDPVHGDLYLTADEMRILDTRQMQRLRGIRQLGTAHLVYPGAQHTRFEHSLGTLHLTQKLIDAINHNRDLDPQSRVGVGEDEARLLRAAALVHDITHMPFGHSIEDQSGILERHDSAARYARILRPDTEVGEVLQDLGILREVLAVLLPESDERSRTVPCFWRELISDTICADILDYLKRDALFTGLNLLYDERVLRYFMVDRKSGHLFVDLEKRGLLREDMLSEIVRVLEARYFFSERVYYHHTKIAAGAMLARLVEGSLLQGGLPAERLYDQTDDSLLQLLERHPPSDPRSAGRHLDLIDRFRTRRLLKRACVFPRYVNIDVQDRLLERFFARERWRERAELEKSVEDRLRAGGVEPPVVVLYCPSQKMQLKEAATHVRFPGEQDVHPLLHYGDRIPRLRDLEQRYRDLWKLYVLTDTNSLSVLQAVANAVKELLPEAVNVYRPAS